MVHSERSASTRGPLLIMGLLRRLVVAAWAAYGAEQARSPAARRLFFELSCGEYDPAEDCEALVEVHMAVGIEGWAEGTSYCTWPGVLCDDESRVVGLSVRAFDLRKAAAAGDGKDRDKDRARDARIAAIAKGKAPPPGGQSSANRVASDAGARVAKLEERQRQQQGRQRGEAAAEDVAEEDDTRRHGRAARGRVSLGAGKAWSILRSLGVSTQSRCSHSLPARRC